jgi:hypothetical protein
MVCPECKRRFSTEDSAVCPYCGVTIAAGVVKSSTILIAAGEQRGVFRSVEEVPEPLRAQLVQSTSGAKSRTIIIADRRMRPKFVKAQKPQVAEQAPVVTCAEEPPPEQPKRIPPILAALVLLVLAVAAALTLWVIHQLK